jgi:hypothetical protein
VWPEGSAPRADPARDRAVRRVNPSIRQQVFGVPSRVRYPRNTRSSEGLVWATAEWAPRAEVAVVDVDEVARERHALGRATNAERPPGRRRSLG